MESVDKPMSLTAEEQSILDEEASETEKVDQLPIDGAASETYNTDESVPNADSLQNPAGYRTQVGKGKYIRLRFSEVEC